MTLLGIIDICSTKPTVKQAILIHNIIKSYIYALDTLTNKYLFVRDNIISYDIFHVDI